MLSVLLISVSAAVAVTVGLSRLNLPGWAVSGIAAATGGAMFAWTPVAGALFVVWFFAIVAHATMGGGPAHSLPTTSTVRVPRRR